jgi:hypothetical protein
VIHQAARSIIAYVASVSSRSLAVVVLALALPPSRRASAGTFEVGAGGALVAANGGGDSLTKGSGGLGTVIGYGGYVKPHVMLFGRLFAAFTIEDEQHAHDDVIVSASLRTTAARWWAEGGLGLGFYRGRYRYDSFFDDANYDSEIATPTLILGGGLTIYRGDDLDVFGRVDLAISPFGGEVATALVQAVFGVSVPM